MKRPKFTRAQEQWLCEAIDEWYIEWKRKITHDPRVTNNFGAAKEGLKIMVTDSQDEEITE